MIFMPRRVTFGPFRRPLGSPGAAPSAGPEAAHGGRDHGPHPGRLRGGEEEDRPEALPRGAGGALAPIGIRSTVYIQVHDYLYCITVYTWILDYILIYSQWLSKDGMMTLAAEQEGAGHVEDVDPDSSERLFCESL